MVRRLAVLVLLAAGALLSMPVAPAGAAAREKVHYVGKLERSDAFVAIVRRGRAIRAYVCDGKPKRTTLSVWFKDRLRKGAFSETAAGVRLEAAVGRRVATGTVLLPDDRQFAFRAARVKRRGGLMERNDTLDGRELHSGWIVIPGRRVRGRTTISGTSLIGTATTGPGISPVSVTPPTDGLERANECRLLREDLDDLNELLRRLREQAPIHPGFGATDAELGNYYQRLLLWQAALADMEKRVGALKARIKATCG